jgi:hypothetical protein
LVLNDGSDFKFCEKKWDAERVTGRALGMMSGLGGKEANNDETAEAVHDLVMCDRRRDLRSIVREVSISFG